MSTGPNLVDIVGEQVDLTDQSDKSMAPAIVNFKDMYVPGDITDPDKEKLRTLLKRVFKEKNQPPPPCNGAEKDLILKSLEGRLEKLREQRNTASKIKDTAGARTTIEHIKRLCSFIDTFRKADCNDQGDVYRESSLGELTDSTVDTLLKQFIFVLLQSHVPIEHYKQFTQQAKEIVQKIGKMPSDLEEIIRKFEGKIPNRIKELIHCMKLVPLNIIEKMVQDEIQLQLNKSIDKLKKIIDAKDPFWKVLGSQPTIEAVIDALLEKMKELCAKAGSSSDSGTAISVLTDEIDRLKKLLNLLQENNKKQLEYISQLEDEINTLRRSLASKKGVDQGTDSETIEETDSEILKQLQAKNAELERLLQELAKQNDAYKAKLLLTLSPEQLAKLQANFESLQGEFDKLLQLNKRYDEKEKGLIVQLSDLEKKTSKSSDPIIINANKLLKEALEKLKVNDEDLQRLINSLEEQLMAMQNKHAEKIRELEDQLKILEGQRSKSSNTILERLREKDDELEVEIAKLEGQRSKSSNTILEKLREKDDELEVEIAKLEEQIRALKLEHQAEVEPLKAEILTLKAQNEAYKAQIAELQKLNLQLEAEISRLKGLFKEKEAEIAGLLAAKKALEDNNTILVTKLSQLSSEVAALKQRISDLINHYTQTKDDLEATLARKDAELKTLKSGATTSQKSQAELQGKIAELSKEIEILKNRIFELTEKYTKEKTQLEAEIAGLLAAKKGLEAEIAGLLAAKKALEDNNTMLVTKLTQLSSEVAALKQRISDLINHYTQTKDDLESTLAGKDAELKTLRSGATSSQKSQAELQGKIAELSKEIEILKNRIFELTEKYTKEKTQLEAELVERNTEINALKMGSAASKLELEKLSSEVTSLKQRIDELTVQYDVTKAALNESIKEFESIGPLLDEILADLEKFKIEKDTEIERLKEELKKCSGTSAELDRLKLEKAGLQEQLKDLTGTVSGFTPTQDKAQLFNYLIGKTGELETKLSVQGLSKETIDTFIAALKAKEDELRKCGKDGEEAKLAIDTLTKQLEEMKLSIETKKTKDSELQKQLNEGKDELEKLKAELNKANEIIKTLKGQLSNAQNSVSRLENELKTEKDEVERLKAELIAAKAALEAAKAAFNVNSAFKDQISKEKEKENIEKAQTMVNEIETKLAGSQTRITTLEQELQVAKAEVERLNAELDKANETIKNLQDKLTISEDRVKDLEKKLGLLSDTLQREITDLKIKLQKCMDRDKLKIILSAIIANNDYTPLGDVEIDKDLTNLREAVNKNAWIQYLLDNIKTPNEIKEDNAPDDLIPLIRLLKNTGNTYETDIQTTCYLYFLSSHILSKHFSPEGKETNDEKTIIGRYSGINFSLNNPLKCINTVLPILKLMEEIYALEKEGSFLFDISDFIEENRKILILLKGQISSSPPLTNTINNYFSEKTGVPNNPLTKLYIKLDDKKLDIVYKTNKAFIIPQGISLTGSYSSVIESISSLKGKDLKFGSEDTTLTDTTLTYPVLFYFLINSLKRYLNMNRDILKGNKCLLPKMLQLNQQQTWPLKQNIASIPR